MAQECFECGGTSFSQDGGCRICDECGTVQKRYIEQLSQEDFCDVNRSRLINMIDDGDGDLDMTIQRDYDDDDINNWTTYEMFNVVLHEWTKALCNLGASSHFQQIVFKLWVMYLQHSKLAFKPPTDDEETKTETRNISVHETRDVELITKKQKSVSATSMKFRRNKAKKKTTKKLSELEKLKGKIEHLKGQQKSSKKNSSSMNYAISKVLSRSQNKFEASFTADTTFNIAHEESVSPNKSRCSPDTSNIQCEGLPPDISENNLDYCDDDYLQTKKKRISKKPKLPVHHKRFANDWVKDQNRIYEADDNKEKEKKDDIGEVKENKKRKYSGDNIVDSSKGSNFHQESSERHTSPSTGTRKAAKRRYVQSAQVRFKLPHQLNFKKLLGLLYLAVLLAKEKILLLDLLRWCREGHLPYMSAQYLLKPNMKLFSRDLFFLKDTMKLPTAKNLLGIAGNLSIFLSIQVVPLPSIGEVIARLIKLLHLPESIKELAQEVLECDGTFLKPSGVNIPTIEVLAMASIIVVLKLNCGIDDNQEFQLSRAAARINAEFQPHNIISPLFSWDEWERYINRVLWFCSEVDPVCALHCQKWDQLFRMDSSQISRFYWTEGVWRNPQTIMKPDKIRQSVTWKLLYNQNQSIDKILNAPSAFKATQQPFMSIIEQFLDQHRGDNSIQEMVKVAEDLTKQSFSDHYLDWTDNICGLQRKLQKCNSNIIIQPEKVIKNNSENNSASKCKDHSKNARDISLGDSSLLGKKRKRSRETKDVVIIPQPLKHVWKVEFARGTSKWKSTFSDLPCSFKWLICLGCLVCETTEEELFYNVVKLDNSCKKVEINSCKNVERKNSCKKVERTNSCKKVERKKKKKLEDSHLHIPSIKSPWEP